MKKIWDSKWRRWTQKEIYLYKLGGRNLDDVRRDSKGEYILLRSGAEKDYAKKYLPTFTDEWLAIHKYDSH